jgi:hypothetical protein
VKTALDDEQIDDARFYLVSADGLDGCRERADKVRDKVAEALRQARSARRGRPLARRRREAAGRRGARRVLRPPRRHGLGDAPA